MAFFYFFGGDYDLCQLSDLLFLDDLLDADFAVAEHGGYGARTPGSFSTSIRRKYLEQMSSIALICSCL